MQLAQLSDLSSAQVHIWDAAILEYLGAPETASVSSGGARSAAITADILDPSELNFALETAFKDLNLARGARLNILDPPYGLYHEDAYDEPPDAKILAILIKYLKEEVCLTRVT